MVEAVEIDRLRIVQSPSAPDPYRSAALADSPVAIPATAAAAPAIKICRRFGFSLFKFPTTGNCGLYQSTGASPAVRTLYSARRRTLRIAGCCNPQRRPVSADGQDLVR